MANITMKCVSVVERTTLADVTLQNGTVVKDTGPSYYEAEFTGPDDLYLRLPKHGTGEFTVGQDVQVSVGPVCAC